MSEPLPTSRDFRGRTRRETWLIVATLAVVVWFYHWTIATAGGFEPAGDDYYNLLVRGYQKGQLHLDLAPAPEMLTLADPYDPTQNAPYRLPDATYFRGHYYLYFGVAPVVLLMWPYAAITGGTMSTGTAVFCFCVLGFLAASGLWLAIRRRYFPASAAWSAAVGILILGLATHVLALARRPTIYELPIAAGYGFTMLALVAVYAARHGRRPIVALGAAGLLLGLAAASRPPCAFGAAMLLPVSWRMWRDKSPRWWAGAVAAGAGLAVCAAAMLAHNYARFGHALEFGQNYQLTSARELSNRHFGLDYMAHNLRVYYFSAVNWTWQFPFVSAVSIPSTVVGYAGTEEMAGLLVTLPFLWLALLGPLAWRGREGAERRELCTILGAIAGLYLGVGLVLLAFFAATERYLAEFAPALGLLAGCGWLGLERWAQRARWRAWVRPPVVVVTLATAAMGVLVSFDYHGRMLSREQPELWAHFERTAHTTLSRIGFWLGQFDGPQVLKVRFVAQPAGTVETFWRARDVRADERIVIEHLGEREVRFGYVRGLAAPQWGRRLTWEPAHTHTVELQLPSLYGAPRGVMRGLRREGEFRERSSVAVWFSGGQALAEIVEPLGAEIGGGGAIGHDFTGELRGARARLFRAEEFLPAFALEEPRGGVLRLRVVLPTVLASDGEPLFAAGALYGSDMVFMREAGGGDVTFHFDHFGGPPLVGPPVRLDRTREHTITILLPSCPASDDFSGAASGEVVVSVDGATVLHGRADCYGFAAGEEAIGRNPFGTTCAREFRGWLLAGSWQATAEW